MKTKKTKTKKRKRTKLAPDIWPTRVEAGDQIGKSERSIRRHEELGELHALPDKKGTFRVDPSGLERLVAQRPPNNVPSQGAQGPGGDQGSAGIDKENETPNVPPATPGPDGTTTAEAFALFNAGKNRREVVVALKLPAALVQKLYEQWVELGGGLHLEESHLGTLDGLQIDSSTPEALVAAMGRAVRDAKLYRELLFLCGCGCGEKLQFTIKVLQGITKAGALAAWRRTDHFDAVKTKQGLQPGPGNPEE